ncbi:MAG TPA: hypothetical protein VN613_11515, partial [Gemmatimonadaceae bacterium]|nr:hypothetical protein [Gemmatimonadaceae bacterium]
MKSYGDPVELLARSSFTRYRAHDFGRGETGDAFHRVHYGCCVRAERRDAARSRTVDLKREQRTPLGQRARQLSKQYRERATGLCEGRQRSEGFRRIRQRSRIAIRSSNERVHRCIVGARATFDAHRCDERSKQRENDRCDADGP